MAAASVVREMVGRRRKKGGLQHDCACTWPLIWQLGLTDVTVAGLESKQGSLLNFARRSEPGAKADERHLCRQANEMHTVSYGSTGELGPRHRHARPSPAGENWGA